MSEAVLCAKKISKCYRRGSEVLRVLNKIDISVNSGERVAIVGASGSGKSTLLHILSGLDTPDEGSVWLLGQCIHTLKERQKSRLRNQHLGFVYQAHHLLPDFDALENVAMPLLIAGCSVSEAKRRANHALEQMGLASHARHRTSELSGGERQRVAIARALINKPTCILADEPTGDLDAQTAQRIVDDLCAVNRRNGTSFVVVTHDLKVAHRMDRVLTLRRGLYDTTMHPLDKRLSGEHSLKSASYHYQADPE